jgi:hypothetical protein
MKKLDFHEEKEWVRLYLHQCNEFLNHELQQSLIEMEIL